jgi:hypothetical protein
MNIALLVVVIACMVREKASALPQWKRASGGWKKYTAQLHPCIGPGGGVDGSITLRKRQEKTRHAHIDR